MENKKENNELEKLHEEICYILQPNITFANGGCNNSTKHFLNFNFLDSLGWVILYVVLPITLSLSSSKIYDFLKSRGGHRVKVRNDEGSKYIDNNLNNEIKYNETTSKNEIDFLHSELEQIFKQIQRSNALSTQIIENTHNVILEFLLSNGWPKEAALEDTKSIIDEINKICITKIP